MGITISDLKDPQKSPGKTRRGRQRIKLSELSESYTSPQKKLNDTPSKPDSNPKKTAQSSIENPIEFIEKPVSQLTTSSRKIDDFPATPNVIADETFSDMEYIKLTVLSFTPKQRSVLEYLLKKLKPHHEKGIYFFISTNSELNLDLGLNKNTIRNSLSELSQANLVKILPFHPDIRVGKKSRKFRYITMTPENFKLCREAMSHVSFT